MTLSPWWCAVTQPPVHVGWYDVQWEASGLVQRLWWYGDGWSYSDANVQYRSAFGDVRGDRWRGVLREDEHG